MEEWLRAVAVLVPKSPSLANFLWEPLGDRAGMDTTVGAVAGAATTSTAANAVNTPAATAGLGRLCAKESSMATLNSITESEDEYDQSGDDAW